jgi:hypothetical protein
MLYNAVERISINYLSLKIKIFSQTDIQTKYLSSSVSSSSPLSVSKYSTFPAFPPNGN